MKNKQFFVLILLLIVGFASVSATLIINGNAKIAANIDDFDVIFIEALLDGEVSPNVEIDSTKKRLTFTTDKLSSVGDTTRLDYKVKNTSTQYDADVEINCTNEENEYVSVTSSFDGSNLPLTNSINMEAQEIKNGYINAEVIKPTTEDKETLITCTINVNATSRINYAYSLTFDSNGGSSVEDKIVEYNTSYGNLSIPEKEGFTFVGWFNELDELVTNETILDTKENKTLTAKWAVKVYPVTIIKNYPDKSETTEINVPYGESINASITIDEKYFINNIECDNGYTIEGFNRDNIVYGNRTLEVSNNKITKGGTCTLTLLQGIYEYSYTGSEQNFNAPYDGNYKFELWGAQGGSYGKDGGKGAYTSGSIYLDNKSNIYIYVGNQGDNGGNSHNYNPKSSFNGGGAGANTITTLPYNNSPYVSSSGGGATDLRLKGGLWDNFDSIKSRIMVAGAGGGDAYYPSVAGAGGALTGISSTASNGAIGGVLSSTGGTQTSGGKSALGTTSGSVDFKYGNNGFFFIGGYGVSYNHPGGGGGGGYYGGAAGGSGGVSVGGSSGAGGSSFISGHTGCNAIAEISTQSNVVHTGQPNHYSGYIFTSTSMIAGNEPMPSHDGASTIIGNSGNGYAKITYLG